MAIHAADNVEREVLKAQSERCRRLAAATYNREIAESLRMMAEEYERTANGLSKKGAA